AARQIAVSHCTNGVVFDPSSTFSGTPKENSIHIDYLWCGPPDQGGGVSGIANCIVAGPTFTARIDLPDVDYEGSGTLIKDPTNLLFGNVSYNLVDTACPGGPTVSGGANLRPLNLKCTSGGVPAATQGSTTPSPIAVFA